MMIYRMHYVHAGDTCYYVSKQSMIDVILSLKHKYFCGNIQITENSLNDLLTRYNNFVIMSGTDYDLSVVIQIESAQTQD